MAEEQVKEETQAEGEQQSLLTDPEPKGEETTSEAEGKPEGEKQEGEQESGEKGESEEESGANASFDPEKLELPEGFTLEGENLESLNGLAEKYGLDQEGAQELVNRHVDTVKQAVESAREQVQQEQAERSQEWLQSVQKDPELSKTENQKQASQFLEKMGATDELKKALAETGLGNHPDLIRIFYKASTLTKEDDPSVDGTPASKEKTIEERLYGSTS